MLALSRSTEFNVGTKIMPFENTVAMIPTSSMHAGVHGKECICRGSFEFLWQAESTDEIQKGQLLQCGGGATLSFDQFHLPVVVERFTPE